MDSFLVVFKLLFWCKLFRLFLFFKWKLFWLLFIFIWWNLFCFFLHFLILFRYFLQWLSFIFLWWLIVFLILFLQLYFHKYRTVIASHYLVTYLGLFNCRNELFIDKKIIESPASDLFLPEIILSKPPSVCLFFWVKMPICIDPSLTEHLFKTSSFLTGTAWLSVNICHSLKIYLFVDWVKITANYYISSLFQCFFFDL